jgi:hypothetical protein
MNDTHQSSNRRLIAFGKHLEAYRGAFLVEEQGIQEAFQACRNLAAVQSQVVLRLVRNLEEVRTLEDHCNRLEDRCNHRRLEVGGQVHQQLREVVEVDSWRLEEHRIHHSQARHRKARQTWE